MKAKNRTEPIDRIRFERLKRAVDALHIDSKYFLDALIEEIESWQPYQAAELPEDEKRFVIESGGWTQEDFDDAARDLARGALHVRMMTSWLAPFLETMSLNDAGGLLDLAEGAVTQEVDAGRLYGVTICGTLRIPVWQFTYRRPQPLLPGLPEIISAVTAAQWDWITVASFFSVPQETLHATGPQTPAQWLLQGGEVENLLSIIDGSGWT